MTGQLERIRVFQAVAEHEGFAAAARELRLSRSIATRYVSELETDLGVQLLVRTTRRVALTLAGRLYLDQVKGVIGTIERANDLIRRAHGPMTGLLRLSAPLSLGLRFMPKLVSQFRILYPDVELKLNLTDRFVDILSDDFDMALRISGPPSDKSTIWRKICAVPRVLVASPDYLLRYGIPRTPADLEDHLGLGYAPSSNAKRWVLHHVGSRDEVSVVMPSPFECDNGDVIGDLAVLGEGIALLPRFIVQAHLDSGALTHLLADWVPPEIWLSAYYPPYDDLPPKVLLFTRLVEDLVATDPGMLTGVRSASRA
jgi:DNA-binding transcriptional LysR family regulator